MRKLILTLALILLCSACDARGYVVNDRWKDGVTFDGVNDYVVTPVTLASTTWTIEAWVKPVIVPVVATQTICSFQTGRRDLLIDSSNSITTYDGTTYLKLASYSSVAGWNHIALAASNGKVYLNGVETTTAAITGKNIGGTCTLGSVFTPAGYSALQLRDFRIWSTARTAAEIQQNMYSRLTGLEPGLVAYYPLDDASNQDPALPANAFPPSSFDSQAPSVLSFNGTTDVTNATLPININYPFTIMSWMMPGASTEYFSIASSSQAAKYVAIYANTTTAGVAARDTTAYNTEYVVAITGMHHIAGVFTSATNRKLYFDGLLVNTGVDSVAMPTGSAAVDIGGISRATPLKGTGRLKGASIWSKALTQAEILTEMQRSTPATTTNLIAYYPLNEKTGSVAADISPNHYDATITGGSRTSLTPKVKDLVTYRENGPFTTMDYSQPTTLYFDGVNDFASIPVAAGSQNQSKITITGWVKLTGALSENRFIYCEPNGQGSGNYMRIALFAYVTDKTLSGYIRDDGISTAYNVIASSPTFVASGAIHVAMVMDLPNLKMYANGILVGESIAGINNFGASAPQVIELGDYYISGGPAQRSSYWPGYISHFKKWNGVALTADQVKQEMYAAFPVNLTGLVGYWPLREGAGDTLYDHSGNGYNGTRTGAAWTQPSTSDGTITNTSTGWQRTIAPFMPPSARNWIQPVN